METLKIGIGVDDKEKRIFGVMCPAWVAGYVTIWYQRKEFFKWHSPTCGWGCYKMSINTLYLSQRTQ